MIQLFTFVMDGKMMYSFRHQIETDLTEKYGEEKDFFIIYFLKKEHCTNSYNLQLLTTQNFPFHQGPICNMLAILLGMGGNYGHGLVIVPSTNQGGQFSSRALDSRSQCCRFTSTSSKSSRIFFIYFFLLESQLSV